MKRPPVCPPSPFPFVHPVEYTPLFISLLKSFLADGVVVGAAATRLRRTKAGDSKGSTPPRRRLLSRTATGADIRLTVGSSSSSSLTGRSRCSSSSSRTTRAAAEETLPLEGDNGSTLASTKQEEKGGQGLVIMCYFRGL